MTCAERHVHAAVLTLHHGDIDQLGQLVDGFVLLILQTLCVGAGAVGLGDRHVQLRNLRLQAIGLVHGSDDAGVRAALSRVEAARHVVEGRRERLTLDDDLLPRGRRRRILRQSRERVEERRQLRVDRLARLAERGLDDGELIGDRGGAALRRELLTVSPFEQHVSNSPNAFDLDAIAGAEALVRRHLGEIHFTARISGGIDVGHVLANDIETGALCLQGACGDPERTKQSRH